MKVNLSQSKSKLSSILPDRWPVERKSMSPTPLDSMSNQQSTGNESSIGYCMRCKTKVPVPNGIITLNAIGGRILKGNCEICNSRIHTILPKLK